MGILKATSYYLSFGSLTRKMYSYVTCVTGAHNTVFEQILRNGSGTDLLQIFKKEPYLIGLIGLLNEVCLEGCYPGVTLQHMVVFLPVTKSRGGEGRPPQPPRVRRPLFGVEGPGAMGTCLSPQSPFPQLRKRIGADVLPALVITGSASGKKNLGQQRGLLGSSRRRR